MKSVESAGNKPPKLNEIHHFASFVQNDKSKN